MKTGKLLIFLMLLTFFYGCKEQGGAFAGKSRYGLKFKHEYKFPPGNPVLRLIGGNSIQIIDTLLLIQHQYENPAFHWDVYGLNGLQHLKSILRHGRGPLEVLFAHYAGQHETVNGENWMYCLDMNSARFLKINLDKSIRSGVDAVELVSPFDPAKSPCFAISNELFLYRDYDRKEGSVNLVKGDNSWKNPTVIRALFRNVTDEELNKLTYSFYYNKVRNKVCVVPSYLDRIHIVDLEGDDDIIASTAVSDEWQTVRRQDFPELTVFYTSTRITDDYIFALYTNKKITEMGNIPDEVEIHVFNWDGDAVAKLRFEDKITSFAVDMKRRVLYGMDNLEQLYAYDFSGAI